MSRQYDYDVIIIGAGIGGLVCGCYLTKKGYRVLIIEQHSKPGGYCSAFTRKGYKFNIGIHSLGGINNGILSKILDELEIKEELKFSQSDPSDKIIMPDCITYIRANPNDTIKEFQKTFPEEKKNIEDFFHFVMQPNILAIYSKVKNMTMSNVLNSFFNNERLKATISVLFLSNMGLPHTEVAAFAAIVFLREFILDPGYVPRGGIHQFTNCLVDKFKKQGGELMLSHKVVKIIIEDNIAKGVVIYNGEKIMSKSIVSNIDVTQTFKDLIDIKTRESILVDSLVPSNSIFAVYLGMNAPILSFFNENCNIWYFTTYDIDGCYRFLRKNILEKIITGILISFPSMMNNAGTINNNTIQILTIATYENEDFWSESRHPLSEVMLSLAEKVVSNLRQHLDLIITATPSTFYRYTLNKGGAAYGWASNIKQIDSSLLPQKSSIRNLFLAGHWCTMGAGQGGISTVALSGKKTAEIIIKQFRQDIQVNK